MARGLSKVSPKTLDQGYNLGKLVWGKVLSHPWWPGQIYDEDLASLSTWITKKKGCVLVAFFGDNTYRWLDPEHVVSFEHQFHEKLKQSQDELFLKAVEDAMFEVKKRSALGLTCKCRNPSNFRSSEVQGYFEVDVAGYAAGSLYTAEQIEKARNGFQPHALLSFLQKLALSPNIDLQQNVTWIENMARVLAYRKAVFEEYDEPYFQAFGVQPMYNEHRADVSYSKKNAHHANITPNSLVLPEATKTKEGTSMARAPVAQPSTSAGKRALNSASSPSAKRFKYHSDNSDSVGVSFQAPNPNVFASNSVPMDKNHERGQKYLRDTKNLTEEAVRAPFSTYVSNRPFKKSGKRLNHSKKSMIS